MYKLEDRILFDGAAVADVVDAQQEADAQAAEAAAQAAEAEEAEAQQEAADSAESGDIDGSESSDPGSLEEVLAAVEAGSLGGDGQRVDVLLVSDSLENANDICNTADASTIVVRYDARTTSAADLLQQITDALDGNLADSIGFATESGENAVVQLFADTDTSLDTVNDSVHQNFFNTLDGMIDEGGQVNLFASNLASSEDGTALVDAIGDALSHDVAASTDETGSESAGGDWNLEYSTNDVEIDAADVYLDENLVDNFDSLLEDNINHEVAFINASVMKDDPIVQILELRGVEIVRMEFGQGISQINDYMAEHSDIDGVHIITHGNDGYFLVGSDNINMDNLNNYAESIAAWSNSLTDDADIMIYGCNLAQSGEGKNLVEAIADLTGADVAASNDDTGSRGDWELEYTSGDIDIAALAVHDYQYSLANHQVNSLLDNPIISLGDGVITLRRAIAESLEGDSITFASFTVLEGDTITLSAAADPKGYGQLEITTQITIDGTITITGGYLRATVTNDAADDFRLLYVADTAGTSDTPVDIYNMVFDSGEASVRADIDYVGEGNGGGIYNAGALNLRDVDVTNSSADINGGGIYVASTGYLKVVNDSGGSLYNSRISTNRAGTSGGGIFNNAGDLELVGFGSATLSAVYIDYNSAAGSGGAIYSVGDITTTYVYIGHNEATGGDGGGMYISGGTNLSSFSTTNIEYNEAAGDGGGIYFFQSQNLNIANSWVNNNTAVGDGGGIYVNESGHLRVTSSNINNNQASGDGGGVYLVESGNFYHNLGSINNNTADGSGGAIYMTQSGHGAVDGYDSDLYLHEINISGNTTTNMDGTIYYDGVRATGVDGAGSTIVYMTAIDNNTVSAGSGGAIYQLAGDLSVWSSTLAFNSAFVNGGAIHFTGNSLDVEFATLAYNTSNFEGTDIYTATNALTVKNSIIYDDPSVTGSPLQQQILLVSTPTTTIFDNNIYTNYSEDAILVPAIATMVQAGSGNIVNNDAPGVATGDNNTAASRADITEYLYLDTAMREYNNYNVRVLPLLVDYNQNRDASTEEFGWRNIAWKAGTTDYNVAIEYDTRGNTRTGWEYDKDAGAYVQNDAPSIGAFEPIYTIVVTNKDSGGNLTYFDGALADGISLSEAINWMDSYDAYTYAKDASNNGALYNKERYVQFDSTIFASTVDNTISISSSITIAKSIIIGMTPWLNDQLNIYTSTTPGEIRNNDINLDINGDPTTDMTDWGGFRAEDSYGRITVSGNGSTSIFNASELHIYGGTRRVYLNNLTITEGYSNNTGGGINNSTNLFLSNVAVTNSTADNSIGPYASNSGWGGGIYNTGSLTLVDSTVSGNTAIGYSTSTSGTSNAGVGGGIYSTGALTISSSSIYNNTAQGSTYVSNEAAMGAGIYFNGGAADLTITNTTIADNTNNANYTGAGDLHGQGSAIYLESGNLHMYYNTVVSNTSERNIAEATTGISAAIVSAYDYDVTTAREFFLYNNIIADNDYSFTGSPTTRNLWDLYIVVNDPAVTPVNVIVLNNAIGWTTGLTINETGGTANNNNNIIGDSTFGKVANLNLEATMAYNGGKTKSYKLLDNSVAYQNGLALNGSGSLPTVVIDQRGNDRIYAGADTTIGSYQPLEYIVVTSTADDNNSSDIGFDFASNSGGWMKSGLQLREAFALADIYTKVVLGDTIEETDPTVTLNQADGFGELAADIGFTLDGRSYAFTTSYNNDAHAYTMTAIGALAASVNPIVIDATNQSRVIRISDDTVNNINVTISYATLQNGNSTTQGGAIYNFENLTLDHVSVLDSTATLLGGGIYSQVGMLTITDSLIQGNSTTAGDGGGLYYESNSLNIARTSFLANTSSAKGGGLYTVGAQVFMEDSTVGNNVSGTHGGGIYSDSSDFFTINSTIANNTAGEAGGGIAFSGGGYLRMGYVTIANNISGADASAIQKSGAGLYQSAGSLNIYNSIIAQNYETSVDPDNLNDIYLGTAVSFTSAQVQNNVLGVAVNNSGNAFSATNRVYSAGLYGGLVLNLDTVLSDNGGPTQTVYVGDLDAATVNYGADLYYTYTAANNTYALSLTNPPVPLPTPLYDEIHEITTDQRGETRTSGSITVGAYQKNTSDFEFDNNLGTGNGDYTNYENWRYKGGARLSEGELDFDITDARFHIAADLVTADSTQDDWTINWRSVLILDNAINMTVGNDDTLNARIDVRGTMDIADTGTLQLRGYSSVDNEDVTAATGVLRVRGTISTVDTTLNGESSLELENEASLALLTLSYAPTMTLINSSTSTTVTYSYNEAAQTQQIIDVKDSDGNSTAYGNLILSGASAKTFGTNLTVQTLTLSGTTPSLDLEGDLTVTDATLGSSSSVAGSSINMTGDLTLGTGASTAFNNVDFIFDGTTAQQISLTGDSTFNSLEIDNSDGISLDDNTLTLTDFTFTDGAFTLNGTSSLYVADGGSVTGADGDSGRYFITAGTGTVSLEIDAVLGTNFVLAVEDGTSGTYKWVDTLITRNGADPATRAAIGISDGITPLPTDANDVNSSITVTWDINPSGGTEGFTFELAGYSANAAGKYFDPSMKNLYHYSTQWDAVTWTNTASGSYYVGHNSEEVYLNSDDGAAGTLRYAINAVNNSGGGAIVFVNSNDFLDTYANIVLTNGALKINDNINVSIFGLDTGYASYITGGAGEQVMIVGTGGATSDIIVMQNLDFRGNDDYVLVNNENLTLSNVSVAGIDNTITGVAYTGKWTAGTIDNTIGTITVDENSSLILDGSAAGNAFTYNDGSTLQYMPTLVTETTSVTIGDASAEFGTSIQNLTVDSGVTLKLSNRTGAYVLNGNVDINGALTLQDSTAITLNGSTVDLGSSFTAGDNSTVTYDGSTIIDDVTYANLALSSSDKDATNITATNLIFNDAITLSLDGVMSVDTLTHGNGTVNYDGDAQAIDDLGYYNLTLSGTGTRTANDLTVLGTMLVSSDSPVTIAGDLTTANLTFTAASTMTLSGDTNDLGTLTAGTSTIIYDGSASQTVYGATYNNLQIANGNKTLNGNATVAGAFTFDSSSGYLALGDYNFNIQDSITGASGTGGRYFVTNGTGSLALDMDESAYISRDIVIGSTANWSNLTLLNLGTAQTISISAADGINNIVTLANVINMTFTVSGNTADFRMVATDSSAKGANFSVINANVLHYNPAYTMWDNMGNQYTAILSDSGSYYFDSSTVTGSNLLVTNTNDSGFGSLRNAIEYANSNAGIDTIRFHEKVFNNNNAPLTITLTIANGELSITDDVIIEGPGAMIITVTGQVSGTRIFNIDDGDADNTIMVKMSGLNITQGNAGTENGGGIYNNEFLILEDIAVSNSSAANGGGIYNDANGSIYMNRVQINENTASADGAGLYNYGGKIQAENLYMNANLADNDGGAIYNAAYVVGEGEEAVSYTGEIILQNTTLSNNKADNDSDLSGGGGAIFTQGKLYGENLTISNNTAAQGSAIYIDGQATAGTTSTTLYNNTIALNTASVVGSSAVYRSAPTLDNLYVNSSLFAGNYDGSSYLNISDTSTNYIGITNYLGGDAESAGTESSDGLFTDATPQDHGGWVKTLALNTANTTVINSIMNSGSNDGPTIYDARGFMRNGTRDIGAYEANAYVARNVDRNLYYTSVQGAINESQAGEKVELFATRYYLTSELTIAQDLILIGQGKDTTVLDAQTLYASGTGSNRLLNVNDGTDDTIFVRVDGMTLRNGSATDGGAISNTENLLLNNVSIYGSSATSNGGAIYNNGGFLYVERSEIYNNNVTNSGNDVYGGAIYNDMGKVRITESTLRNNIANGDNAYGGAIYTNDDGTGAAAITIISSALYNNTASGTTESQGGAIYADGATQVEITNSTFAHNAAEQGSAMYFADSGTYKFTNITVAYNETSNASSGAVIFNGGDVYIINSLFLANYNNGAQEGQDINWNTDTDAIFNSTGNVSAAGYFADTMITDHGGWSKTIALAAGSAAIDNGTNSGVPDHDQRGYDTNGTRDQGAYEYNGIVAYYWNADVAIPSWVGTSTISAAGIARSSNTTDVSDHVIKLVNTRILESDITIRAWRTITDALATRTVSIYGHQEGGTVVDAGYEGQTFNIVGTRYMASGATDYTYVMGTTNIDRLTMTNGFTTGSGGAITATHADGAATINISNSSLINSIATSGGGAVASGGADAGWGDKKDAIYNITNSLLAYNITAGSGGAASVTNKISFTSSTIAYNRSFANGGAVMVNAEGAGAIENSTVSRNFASTNGGGVYLASGYTIGNTLLAKNRTAGAIWNRSGGNSTLDPAYESGYDYFWGEGTLTNGGNNLVEFQNGHWIKSDATNFFGPKSEDSPVTITNGDLLGAKNYVFSTEAVADHGGWTKTMELAQNSAAVDKGSGSGADQRGYDINRAKDIGAFELNGIVAKVNGQSYSTIEEAIAAATTGSTINLVSSRITEHDLHIGKNLTIKTESSNSYYSQAVIDAKSYGRAFAIESSTSTVSLANMILANSTILVGSGEGGQQAAGNGGAIFSAGTLNLSEVSIGNSFAQLSGGAIYSTKSLTITTAGINETESSATSTRGAYFARNSAQGNGGAIYASNALSITGEYIVVSGETQTFSTTNMVHFDYNFANAGGAIYASHITNDNYALEGVQFVGNNATTRGGAVYMLGSSDISFNGIDFRENSAMRDGGAVYASTNSALTLRDVDIYDNFAFGDGGALYYDGLGNSDSTLTYYTSGEIDGYFLVSSNESLEGSGGAFYVKDANLLHIYTIDTNSPILFTSNNALKDGGAVYVTNTGTGASSYGIILGETPDDNSISNTTSFSSNKAGESGGAIYMADSGNFYASENVDMSYNTVGYNPYSYAITGEGQGGAVYVANSGDFTFKNSSDIYGNTSYNSGGAFYIENSGLITLDGIRIADNTSWGFADDTGQGGGLYLKGNGNISFNDTDFYDNHSAAEGGAVYIENGTNEDRCITITNSSFDRNMVDYSTAYGGALYVDNAKAFNIANTSFAFNDNTALYFGYGALSLNFTTFAYNASGATTDALGIYFAGATDKTSAFVVNNSILHDGTSTSGGTITGTPYSFGDTVGIAAGKSTNNIYTNFHNFAGVNAGNLTSGSLENITAYLPYGDTGATAAVRDANGNLVGDATTSAFIYNNLYLSTDMDYTGNRLNRALATQSINSIANRYIYEGNETFAGNIAKTASYDRTGTLVDGLMLIDNLTEVWGWSSHTGGASEYEVAADGKPLAVYAAGVMLTEAASTEIDALGVNQWTWDAENNKIVVRLTDNANPNSTVMTTRDDTNSTIIYDQRGNMRSGITVSVDGSGAVSYTYYTYGEIAVEVEIPSETGGESETIIEIQDSWIKVTVAEDGTATQEKATAADVHAGMGTFKANLYMTVTTNADNEYSPYAYYNIPEFTTMDNALADGVTLREAVYWIDTYDMTNLDTDVANAKFDADRYVKFADSMFENGNNLIELISGQITMSSDVVIGMTYKYGDYSYTDSATGTTHYFEADNTFRAQSDSSRITISGLNKYRIFDNSDKTDLSSRSGNWEINPTLGLNNLTVTDGHIATLFTYPAGHRPVWSYAGKGGAIYNGSTMYINNTVVKDSLATNVGGSGSLSDYGHGGGIYNAGTMTIQDSTISGNEANGTGGDLSSEAGIGGGIFNRGTMTVKRSLIADNHVIAVIDKDTVAGDNSATGGGIFTHAGTLNLFSSTLSGNYITAGTSETVDGAALTVWSGTANLYGNTISYNDTYDGSGQAIGPARPGYAVYLRSGTSNVKNNIFAQNFINGDTAQNRRDIIVKSGVNLTETNNIIGSYYQASGYYDFAAHVGTSGDILGFNASGLVTNLNMSSDLLYNGGMTQNYRIETASVAIEAGDYTDLGITYDQRNALEQGVDTSHYEYDERTTIGAYELITHIDVSSEKGDAALPADGIAYDFENNQGGWLYNLRNALYLADQGATVTVNIASGHNTFDLSAGELLIFNAITLTTDGSTLTINGGNSSRIFAITDPESARVVNVTLENLALVNAKVTIDDRGGLGGAIYTTEGLTLKDVSISSSTAASHGGAIYSLAGGLTLTDVTIDNATSTNGDGGAINQQTDAFSATNLTISNSSAGGSGGAIYITDGSTFSLTGTSEIHDNESGSYGGGIYFRGGDMTITDAYIYDNAAAVDKDGGGLYVNSSGNITITTSTFGNSGTTAGNTAARGAGIFVYAGSLAMTNSTISGNTATKDGGGLYFDGTTLSLTYVTVANNYSGTAYSGGGVYMKNGSLEMINSVIAQNHAGTTTSSSPSDFYLSASASVSSATYSAIGQSNYDFSGGEGNIVGVDGIIEDLNLDTSLYLNGDDSTTPTLYVMNNSVLVGAGSTISVTNSQNDPTGTRANPPTIGAYEGGSTVYYYVGGDVNDVKSWNTDINASYGASGNPDFDDADNLYTFADNGHAADFSTGTWEISDRSFVTVAALGSFTISGDAVVKAFVHRTPATIANMTISVKDNSGIEGGTLTFNTGTAQYVTLSELDTGSNVNYTFAGDQTIYVEAEYGNLTISGTGTKTAEAVITVNGDFTNDSDFVSAYDLTVNGFFDNAGSLTIPNIYLNGGGTSQGTITATTITATDSLTVTGDITATDFTVANTLNFNNNASITTVNADLNLIVSNVSGNDSSIKLTGVDTDSNFSDWVINVEGGSILTINRGTNDIQISDGSVDPSFNATNMTVDSSSTVKFVTTGDATLTDIDSGSTGMADFIGTLWIKCDDIAMPGCDFSVGDMSLIIENSGYFDLVAGTTLTFGKSISINNVRIIEGAPDATIATLASTNGDVTISDVISVDPTFCLTINALNGSATIGGATINEGIKLADITLNAGNTATVNGVIDILGSLSTTAATTDINNNVTTGADVTINGALDLAASIAATGDVSVTGTTTISGTGDTSITGDSLDLDGAIGGTGTGTLTLGATGTDASHLAGVTLTNGNLTLSDGSFDTTAAISAVDLGISSPATLTMGANTLTASGSLTNAGTVASAGTVNVTGNINNTGTFSASTVDVGGNLTNSNLFTATTVDVDGNMTNSGTFTSTGTVTVGGDLINTSNNTFNADTARIGGDLTDTGAMNVTTMVLTNHVASLVGGLTGASPSITEVSFTDGTTFATFTVEADKHIKLTAGNIIVGDFSFEADATPTSKFEVASGTSVDVTGSITYNATNYTSNYFITSGGGQLIRTMDNGNPVLYRVGNSTSVTEIYLTVANDTEKIAVSVIDGVKINDETITGIEETVKFTTVIDRNYGGTSFTNDIVVSMNWDTSGEGSEFNTGDTIDLYTLEGNEWTSLIDSLTITEAGGRSSTGFTLPHNGTYTIGNAGAEMTIPPLPMNVNIYEMANPHYLQMYTDLNTNVMLNFEMGLYPYFSSNRWVTPENMHSVGQSVYRQMEYRLTTDPQTNPLYGQVPPAGAVLDQAVTQGVSLNLTSDAPVYLEVNGEYSVGKDWLSITEPASIDSIEQYQEPITQGQIDQFYLEFGGREDIFDKPVSFKSDLDEMLDDLLAG